MTDTSSTPSIDAVLARMATSGDSPALFWRGAWISYAEFLGRVSAWEPTLEEHGVGRGSVVGFLGEYSPGACSLIYALMRAGAIIVPFSFAGETEMPALAPIAGLDLLIRFDREDGWSVENPDPAPRAELITRFLDRGRPGLVVFSSGSTGKLKGILQDCEQVMRKFVDPRPGWRTVLFLLIDHFGGFNTLLGALAYGGVGVCVDDRTPDAVCRTIAESGATLLPTTPTFLNLVLASGAWKRHDLTSLKLITYGTEAMPQTTLERINEAFPNAEIKQTYGLSELGVLRSRSAGNDSLWLKVGGSGFETKIVDGILWVRSEANMVGYLNAPDPFDDEGWMCTGDEVEVKGDMLRFLGRRTEIINVGGQKVFPTEVEAVLLAADNVVDAIVFGVAHPLLGQMAAAKVTLAEPEDAEALGLRLRRHCLERLAKFKVPGRFTVVDGDGQHGARFKKARLAASEAG